MATPKRTTILLIEDSPSDARLIKESLRDVSHERFTVIVAPTLAKGLHKLEQDAIDAILLDLALPDSHGIDTFRAIVQHAPTIPVVILTVTVDEALREEVVQEGAQDYIPKVVLGYEMAPAMITHIIRYAIERKRAANALQQAHAEVQELNERLQSANEQLSIVNEELQHGLHERTQELATANEELRAANEGLTKEIEQRINAEREAQKYAHRTAVFNDIIHAINEATDLPTLYKHALVKTIELLGFQNGFVATASGDHLDMQYERNLPSEFAGAVSRIRVSANKYLRAVYQRHELIVLDQAPPDSVSFQYGLRGSIVIIPFLSEGSTVGHITLFAFGHRSFSPEERELFGAIGREIGTAVAKIVAKVKAEEYALQQNTLNRIIKAGNEARDLRTMLHALVDTVLELLGFDGCSVHLLNEADKVSELKYQRGYPPSYARQLKRISLTQRYIARLYSGEPLFYERHLTEANGDFKVGNLVATAGIPLTARERVIGFYGVFSRGPHRFVDSEKALLLTLGREAGTAIARMQAEEALKEGKAQLKQYSEHLEELVEQRTAELKEAERLAAIGETTAMIGHDLRNPLQALQYTLELERKYFDAMPSDIQADSRVAQAADRFTSIEQQIQYMDKIVADLQDYARPLTPEREKISVAAFIDNTLSALTIPEAVNVHVDAPDITAAIDPYLIQRALSNLIINATQAMPEGGELTINAAVGDDAVTIIVHDTGEGVPENMKEMLFSPLTTGKAKGTGLGLAVVKRIVEAHNGTIEFASEEGKGTTFTVTLPQTAE